MATTVCADCWALVAAFSTRDTICCRIAKVCGASNAGVMRFAHTLVSTNDTRWQLRHVRWPIQETSASATRLLPLLFAFFDFGAELPRVVTAHGDERGIELVREVPACVVDKGLAEEVAVAAARAGMIGVLLEMERSEAWASVLRDALRGTTRVLVAALGVASNRPSAECFAFACRHIGDDPPAAGNAIARIASMNPSAAQEAYGIFRQYSAFDASVRALVAKDWTGRMALLASAFGNARASGNAWVLDEAAEHWIHAMPAPPSFGRRLRALRTTVLAADSSVSVAILRALARPPWYVTARDVRSPWLRRAIADRDVEVVRELTAPPWNACAASLFSRRGILPANTVRRGAGIARALTIAAEWVSDEKGTTSLLELYETLAGPPFELRATSVHGHCWLTQAFATSLKLAPGWAPAELGPLPLLEGAVRAFRVDRVAVLPILVKSAIQANQRAALEHLTDPAGPWACALPLQTFRMPRCGKWVPPEIAGRIRSRTERAPKRRRTVLGSDI